MKNVSVRLPSTIDHQASPIPAYEQELRSREIGGLTLIELLVAMGIAVLLAAVVFAIYAGVLRALDSQNRWRAQAYPAASALDALTLDLACAVAPWGITNASFVLSPSPAGGIKLHFFTAAPQGTNARAYALREMDYALAASKTAGAGGLVRAWSAFRINDPAGVASNRETWESVRAIRLEVFDGQRWTNAWGGGTNALLPQAARVTLAVGDESAGRRSAEVLIPAGRRIAPPKNRK
ncbi:MAG: hypothetical protein WC130_12635 [Kiritimatiellia bacterium]